MEFDVGNLFYIIITLIVVIVGILGKKKKPAPGSTGSSGSKPQPGFLENLERVLSMGQEQPGIVDLKPYEDDLPVEEVFQEPKEVQRIEEMPTPGIMEAYERILNRDSVQDLFATEGEQASEPIEVMDLDAVPGGTDYLEIIREFDVGTAVVYSAIINRLDY